jgi:hypothetical protein
LAFGPPASFRFFFAFSFPCLGDFGAEVSVDVSLALLCFLAARASFSSAESMERMSFSTFTAAACICPSSTLADAGRLRFFGADDATGALGTFHPGTSKSAMRAMRMSVWSTAKRKESCTATRTHASLFDAHPRDATRPTTACLLP